MNKKRKKMRRRKRKTKQMNMKEMKMKKRCRVSLMIYAKRAVDKRMPIAGSWRQGKGKICPAR